MLSSKVLLKRVFVFAIFPFTSFIFSSFLVSTFALGFKGVLLFIPPFELLKTGFLSVVVAVVVEVAGAVAPVKGAFLFFKPVLLMNLGLLTPPWVFIL